MILRKALVSLALGSTLLATVGTLAPAAQAAPATTTAVAVPMDSCPCNPPAGIGWNYLDNYFWHSDCDAAGRRELNTGRFSEYQCTGGGVFSNYELWVR
ncbi:MAG: hypothetical protein QOD01_1561 [Actinomycetota bacterium]|jgi:hypothetical protein|nr:hypothetical protein [Actinomycetota bacterium]